jgi:hypothetical protein
MSLNVMVLESERGAADDAARELAEAGHIVLRCHEPGAALFPCRGLIDASTCPLRSHAVDVAVTVRSGVSSRPTPSEDGARCALMNGVQLVVAGPAVLDPYVMLDRRVLGRTYDVVAACEDAAAAEMAEYARRAEAVIAGAVGNGVTSAAVSVVRREGGLCVRVAGLQACTPRERQVAVVKVLGVIRALDRSARTIDVALTDSVA